MREIGEAEGHPGSGAGPSARPPQDRRLRQIVDILARILGDKPCAVYLFGSRAEGTHRPGSDYDIAVWSNEDMSTDLSLAREALEESTVPQKIDLVDLSRADPVFVRKIREKGLLVWRS